MPESPLLSCATCGNLNSEEYARQKYGWPQDDTHLPLAVGGSEDEEFLTRLMVEQAVEYLNRPVG